ncbi:glycoside hydrolase family 27 protein [Butyrivibrio sp. DSM 10294]|uniref:glycoside hydrolase family 27 protein n=1 Tax=Butyrivibrio sp. DSM 10294 TaxID=2972457 RepID=UPI00234F7AB4|nr:glycoside hydrolase family 27 protein [Butyrivibrio sp. DSM 10294]MDC7293379.1 glycoside hydrolase family 27 protein [Butyrivibrio sp. DSM 10294]
MDGYKGLTPDRLNDDRRYDSFSNGQVLLGKKKNHLPAMGWNSWNAFGSGNTEALTKAMADKMVELGLDKLGYKYVVLDDGCYKNERVDGLLSNEEVKFPSGFKALSDYIHDRGLKFGMYNDIGSNLCAGAAVGTCGHEKQDAASYVSWGVDFLKVDNCYYLFDNATFSNPCNARYTYAPAIHAVTLKGQGKEETFTCGVNLQVSGNGVRTELIEDRNFFSNIGTFDGTGPETSPVGDESGEIFFDTEIPSDGEYTILVDHINGAESGIGSWLQIAAQYEGKTLYLYDDFFGPHPVITDENKDPKNPPDHTKPTSTAVTAVLKKGKCRIRLMNHRRQENTLNSYARLLEGLSEADPSQTIIYSACEWGKTQPANWGYKVCDSWRILNDITFRVGSDGDPGVGTWTGDYTTSVTTQYSKAVIMDEFAGLDKGWNDPDMLMIGMNGLDLTQNRTHMTMWAMMNSPLMLGLDLRRVTKGDDLYGIIANKDIIALNQDSLGIQAKRVYSTLAETDPSKEYIRDIDRVDILAKPLSEGRFALSFINVSEEDKNEEFKVDMALLKKYLGDKISEAPCYEVKDLWTGEISENTDGVFSVNGIRACDNITVVITPKSV